MTTSAAATRVAQPATPSKRRKRRKHATVGQIIARVVAGLILIVWIAPILGMFISSWRSPADQATSGWWTIVLRPLFTTYNYQQALSVVSMGDSVVTSLTIAIPVTVLTVLLSAIGGFALSRIPFFGRVALLVALVSLMVVPPQLTLVPLLQLFGSWGIVGTVPAVWLFQVSFTLPYGIFLVRGFIAELPGELFEAAAIDGASAFTIFRSIVLPLTAPILAALAILQFLWSWNDLLIPLLFLGGSDLAQPVTVEVAGLVQQTGQGESMLNAATFMSIVIPLVVLLLLQRYFVRGLTSGGVKA